MSDETKPRSELLDFYTNFKTVVADILDSLSHDSPDIDTLSQSTARLRQSLQDAQASLPSHDKALYDRDIQQLENRINGLRKASSSKFSFKRSGGRSKPSDPKPAVKTQATPLDLAPATDPSTLTLSSLSSQTITPNSLPTQTKDPTALTVSDTSRSWIDLRALPPLLAFHASNISDSILLLPHIRGSVILHSLTQCVVFVQCQQFRLHASRDTALLLDITSTPIIEGSVGLRFGALREPPSPSGLSSKHHQVRDFDCPESDSPNWTVMDTTIEAELNTCSKRTDVTLDAFLSLALDKSTQTARIR